MTPRDKNDRLADDGTGEARLAAMDPNASISRKLKEYYGSLQDERIPDRFLDLLERLDEAERNAGAAGTP